MKVGYVYILTNHRNGVLYIGVTSQLIQRVWQHREKVVRGFSLRYNLTRLVWYEAHETIESAIMAEKKLKNRNRAFKIQLIEMANPDWQDLYDDITQ